MMELLEYEAKVAVVLAILYLFYKLLLSRETFHRFNRGVLIGSVILAFILPFCVITIHRTIELPMNAESPGMSEPVAASGNTWWSAALSAAYLVGVAVMLARIITELHMVRSLIRSGEVHEEEDGVRVAVLDNDVPPFSWMGWIVMSRDDYESGNNHIIEHEKAHIRLGHSKYVLLVDVLASLQWFNPAMWLLRSDLRAIYEYEADDAVLRHGADIKEYQYSLIRKAVSESGYSITNSFNHSILKNRITMMSKSKSAMSGALKALYILPLVAAALTANARTVTTYKCSEIFPESAAPDSVTVKTAGEPLIIIDGKETAITPGELEKMIDEKKIESVTVLKEKSGLEVYGEKGANGVIIIEMKKD